MSDSVPSPDPTPPEQPWFGSRIALYFVLLGFLLLSIQVIVETILILIRFLRGSTDP